MELILDKALTATSENESIDFKRSFNPASTEEWLEIIKDIVAMANSGGGIILIGVKEKAEGRFPYFYRFFWTKNVRIHLPLNPLTLYAADTAVIFELRFFVDLSR